MSGIIKFLPNRPMYWTAWNTGRFLFIFYRHLSIPWIIGIDYHLRAWLILSILSMTISLWTVRPLITHFLSLNRTERGKWALLQPIKCGDTFLAIKKQRSSLIRARRNRYFILWPNLVLRLFLDIFCKYIICNLLRLLL